MTKIIPQGLGIWIWKVAQCDGGDLNKIISKCNLCCIKWVGIKSGDGIRYTSFDSPYVQKLVQLFHDSGIRVYTWNYSKPDTWHTEITQIKSLLDDGVDGHIIDAEIEWQQAPNNRVQATAFMAGLRAVVGDAFIAHAPFAVVNYHSTFPYAEFGKDCDAVMPQSYWTEFNWDVTKTISMTDSSWNLFNMGNSGSKKPVWPIGVTYGKGYPGVQGPLVQGDLLKFLKHYEGLPTSLYSYDAAFPETFATLAALNTSIPYPPIVTAPLPISTPISPTVAVSVAPSSGPELTPITRKSLMESFVSILKFLFHIK